MGKAEHIKIAHILKDAVVGGIQTLLLDTIAYYKEKNIRLCFILIGNGEAKSHFLSEEPNTYFVKKKWPYLDPFLIINIRHILKKEQVDIIHTHHTSEGIAAFFAKQYSTIKWVQSYHVAPAISNKQDNWVFKQLAKRSDGNIAPSVSQIQALTKNNYPTKNFTIIHNGINPKRLNSASLKDIKSSLGINSEHLLMGMVGNLYNPTRDPLTVCKALPIVFKKFPNASFVFFGGHTNDYYQKPESYIACKTFCEKEKIIDKVFFPGIETDVASMYHALDLFIYASDYDTFGIALVEAMLSKTPIIVNDLDVMIEVTQGEANATIYPSKNHMALANAIIHNLEFPLKAREKAEKAYRFALENYSIINHVNALENYYQKILSAP